MNEFGISTKIYTGLTSLKTAFGRLDRVFIVTDAMMRDKLNPVLEQLEGAVVEIFSDVTPDPDITIITKGVEQIQSFQPSAVIAFGGGSPIDAAKAIVFFANKTYGLKDCPFIAIPTTSGTGSEVTRFSIISDKEKEIKYPLIDKSLLPDAALLDPILVKSVPKRVTADTGMDVLTHAMEAFLSKDATDFSDALAEKAFKLAYSYVKIAYQEPNNMEARSAMHNASCLAGMAFDNASLGINHSLAHILGARTKLPHGRANAILLPFVIAFNAFDAKGLCPAAKRYETLAELVGLKAGSTRQSVLNLIKALKKLCSDLEMPLSLEKAGVDKASFFAETAEMSEIAINDRCTATNPSPCTPKDLQTIFEKAYA